MSWMTDSPTWEYPAMEYLTPRWRRWGALNGFYADFFYSSFYFLFSFIVPCSCQCFNRMSSNSRSSWKWRRTVEWILLSFQVRFNPLFWTYICRNCLKSKHSDSLNEHLIIFFCPQMESCRPGLVAIMLLETTRAAWSLSLRTTLISTTQKVTQVELHCTACSAGVSFVIACLHQKRKRHMSHLRISLEKSAASSSLKKTMMLQCVEVRFFVPVKVQLQGFSSC